MTTLAALKEARDVHSRRGGLDRQQKADAAVSLAEWGIYSNRHIAKFVGLAPATVNGLVPKTERTGGRLEPEALQPTIDVLLMRIRGEVDNDKVRVAIAAGVSVNFLAKLAGIPQRTLARMAERTNG